MKRPSSRSAPHTTHYPSVRGSCPGQCREKVPSSSCYTTSIVADQEAREAEKKGPGNDHRAPCYSVNDNGHFEKDELAGLRIRSRRHAIEVNAAPQSSEEDIRSPYGDRVDVNIPHS
jgi:hypothetical protein